MKIGVPKEIKPQEYRVGLVPASVRELVHLGHQVIIEAGAGSGIGITDAMYEAVGAELTASAVHIYQHADFIVKVKEPQHEECHFLREGQIIFCYLHLAADPALVDALQQSGCIAIAYETVTSPEGGLPLL